MSVTQVHVYLPSIWWVNTQRKAQECSPLAHAHVLIILVRFYHSKSKSRLMFTMKCPAALHGPLPPIAQIYESILYVYVYGLWRRAVNTRPPPVAVQTWKHYISEHIFGSLPWKTVNKFQTEKIWRDDMPLSEFNTTVTAVSSTPLQHWPWYHQYVWTAVV